MPGQLNADGNPDDVVYTGARAGIEESGVRAMLDRLGELPATGEPGFWMLVAGLWVGLLILGVALVKGRAAPVWAGAALIAAAALGMLWLVVDAGPVASILVWVFATIGLTGCAVAVLRPAPL